MLDVIVVGAGSSGAAASAFLAEAGLRVLCIERRPLDEAGACWVNGVPRAAFARAGVALPGHDESDGPPAVFHVVAPSGRAVVPVHDVVDIDMRRLVARLQARAVAAGARIMDRTTVRALAGTTVTTDAGPFTARYLVDASGLTGARLLGQPRVSPLDLCAAAQQVHAVRDLPAARTYFEAHGVKPGEVLGLVGVAGGYSVLNVRLHANQETIGILTGSIPALGHPSGKAILDDFVATHPWVGERRFGGSGPIPLRRSHDRLVAGNVALLGDAGCQVFPAHGSGVGAGLVAARMLADTLAAGRPLQDYELAWQREHGGLFAFFDVFRRWNQRASADTIGRMMHLGLVDELALRAGIDQVLPPVTSRTIAAKLRPLWREPSLAAELGVIAVRSAAVRALYARYPRQPALVPHWARLVDRLLG